MKNGLKQYPANLLYWGAGTQVGARAGDEPIQRFYDTFTDTDGVSLSSHVANVDRSGLGWYVLNGTWDINGNAARCSDATAAYRAVVMDAETPNASLSVKLAVIQDTNINVICRGLDINNHWQIQYIAGAVNIVERSYSVVTTRATGAATVNNGDTMRVDCNGNVITVYINGVQKATYTSSLFANCTLFGLAKPGLAGTGWRWDDFQVERIGAMPSVPSISGADVFILAGQSNGSGRGLTLNSMSGGGIFTNAYTYRALVDPVDSKVHQVDSVSIEPNFPSRGSVWPGVMAAIKTATGRTPYVVPCNLGGSTISQWQPGANHQDRTTLYGSMVYRALQAQAAGGVLRAVLLWEGETDAQGAISQAIFNGYLDALANAIDTDLGIPTIPCQIQQLLGGYSVANVNAAIVEAQGDNPNVLAGPDLSGLTSDNNDGLGAHLMSDANIASAVSLWSSAVIDAIGWS